MVSERTLKLMLWGMLTVSFVGCGSAIWSNDSLMGRVQAVASPIAQVVRDSWMEAARMGAPIYRTEGGPVSLPPLPEGKTIVLTGNGYAFATDDIADVWRWYAALTYPALDLSQFPAVRYVYEVEGAELVTEDGGRKVLSVTVHEARTGCVRPACDPVTELPNYDRRYVVKPANATIYIVGGNHA